MNKTFWWKWIPYSTIYIYIFIQCHTPTTETLRTFVELMIVFDILTLGHSRRATENINTVLQRRVLSADTWRPRADHTWWGTLEKRSPDSSQCSARQYPETTQCAFSCCACLRFCICVSQCAFPLTMAPGRSWHLWRLPQRAMTFLPMWWRLLEFLTTKEDCKENFSPVFEVGSPSHSTPKTPVVHVNSAKVSKPEHHCTCPVVLESLD